MPNKQKSLKDLFEKLKDHPSLLLREYLLDEGKSKEIVDAMMSASTDGDEGEKNKVENNILMADVPDEDDVLKNNIFLMRTSSKFNVSKIVSFFFHPLRRIST